MPQDTGSAVPPDEKHFKMRDARTNLQTHPEEVRDSCRHNRDDRQSCPMTMDHQVRVITISDLSAVLPWLMDYGLPGVSSGTRSSIPRGPRRRWFANCHPIAIDLSPISRGRDVEPLDRRTDRDQDRERDRYFLARVTRPPTTKVTRRPVATPAWRVARRVLERGRRDDRRRGGRIDDGGGILERREKKKTRRGEKQL